MSAYDPDEMPWHQDDDRGEYYGWLSARGELLPLLKSALCEVLLYRGASPVAMRLDEVIDEIERPERVLEPVAAPVLSDDDIPF